MTDNIYCDFLVVDTRERKIFMLDAVMEVLKQAASIGVGIGFHLVSVPFATTFIAEELRIERKGNEPDGVDWLVILLFGIIIAPLGLALVCAELRYNRKEK